MDLPTCPACGQSVLDDDATECPFCGAAMDGSSASKKKAGSKTEAPAKRPKKPAADDADPFAIEQAPATSKAIPCARKPMKGRMQRVLCPMCETQGFIPKAAIGRQVKCANKECLVPVFTASTGESATAAPRVPSRVSNDSVAAEVKASSGNAKKNPMLIYGIVGAIGLAAAIGLVQFLNSQGIEELPPLPPQPNLQVDNDEGAEEEVITPPQTADVPVEVPEYRRKALESVETMIGQSRISGGNRDKAFCRRLNGDSYLRLGMPKEANAEFSQMDKVSSDAGRRTEYYRIVPLVADYWRNLNVDAAAAAASLKAARALAPTIPAQGQTAWESAIVLTAAVVHSGDFAAASDILANHKIDESVDSQLDSIRLAAWDSTASVLRDYGRKPFSPLVVFSWSKPLHTAVAVELAVHGQWNEAGQWAASQTELSAASEAFGVVAAEMAGQGKTDAAGSLLEVAKLKGTVVLLRTNSALGRTSATHWQAAKDGLSAMPAGKTIQQTGIQSYIDAQQPNIDASLLKGEAISDYVIAAIAQGDQQAGVAGLERLYQEMTSAVAPTVALRLVSAEVEREEGSLRKKIAAELRLKDSEVRSAFIEYRRGVDRLVKASEKRHRALMYMLSRIVDGGGVEAIRTVLSGTSELKREIQVDTLAGLLYCAAAANRVAFQEAVAGERQSRVRLFRADLPPETVEMEPMLNAWQGFIEGEFGKCVDLQSARTLRGLAAATVRYIASETTSQVTEPQDLVAAVLTVKNGVWREECLAAVTRNYCVQGQISKAIGAVNGLVKSPSQKVAAFHGIVRGALEMEAKAK